LGHVVDRGRAPGGTRNGDLHPREEQRSQAGAPAGRGTIGTIGTGAPGLITLKPAAAHAALGSPPAACTTKVPVSWVQVYPPGQYRALFARPSTRGCAAGRWRQWAAARLAAGPGRAALGDRWRGREETGRRGDRLAAERPAAPRQPGQAAPGTGEHLGEQSGQSVTARCEPTAIVVFRQPANLTAPMKANLMHVSS